MKNRHSSVSGVLRVALYPHRSQGKKKEETAMDFFF